MQKQTYYPYRYAFLSKIREPMSAITHLAGFIAAVVGLPVLLGLNSGEPAWAAALLVYGLSLCLMFLASTVYHTVISGKGIVRFLRKLDHSAIYLLIAGTYTPFCVIAFRGFWQAGFLAMIWALALIGIVSKIVFPHTPRWLTAGIYIVMGWLSAFAAGEMRAVLSPGVIAWMVAGGLAYTIGAGVYVTKKLNFIPGFFGFHEVWHLFVIFGAAAHFAAVARMLAAF